MMEIPHILYENEDIAALAFGIIMINIFLIVTLVISWRLNEVILYILYMETSIISSVILWQKYSIVYFIIIMGTFAVITYPKIWNKIKDKLNMV